MQDSHRLGFGADRADVLAVGLVEHERGAVLQRVVQHVAPHGDRGAVKHRVHVDRAVVAHVFAERPFRLDVAALVEIALERHLGVGRHQDVVGEAFDHRRRLAAQRRDQRQLVAGMAHGRGDEIERMRADGERDRQLFAARHARPCRCA